MLFTYTFFTNNRVVRRHRVRTSSGVQTRVEAVVDELGYDFGRFEVPNFLRHVSEHRGRPLQVYYRPLSPGLFGCWWSTEYMDHIVVSSNLHPIHQIHTLLHETGHILLGHRGKNLADLLGKELVRELGFSMGDGHLRTKQNTLQERDPQEREAEQFVLLVQRELVMAQRLHELYGEPTSIDAMRPYTSALGLNN